MRRPTEDIAINSKERRQMNRSEKSDIREMENLELAACINEIEMVFADNSMQI